MRQDFDAVLEVLEAHGTLERERELVRIEHMEDEDIRPARPQVLQAR
jgi:hypothetical protein